MAIKIHTKGEFLLIMVSNLILFHLTKYEGDFSFRGRSFDKKSPKKIIVDQNKFNVAGKVYDLLQPFMNKSKSSLFNYYPLNIKNTESPEDFDPTKLYEFRDICIESLKKQLPFYSDSLKHFENYKNLLEEIAKKKNKVPKTKKITNNVLNSKHTLNQINYMIQVFSDAEKPEDLIKLKLFSK